MYIVFVGIKKMDLVQEKKPILITSRVWKQTASNAAKAIWHLLVN